MLHAQVDRLMSVFRLFQVALIVAGLALAMVAPVGGSSPVTSATTPGARPSGTRDIALRMESSGGLVPIEARLLRLPTFTLYSDGLAVYRPLADPESHDLMGSPLRQAALTEQQVVDLLAFALDEGGLAEARGEYGLGGIADAPATVFTLKTAGLDRRVSVYALGIDDGGPEQDAYRSFGALATVLADFGSWLPEDATTEPFAARSYVGVFAEEDPGRAGLVPWPWDDLAPGDLAPLAEAPFFSTAVLSPSHVEEVMPAASSEATALGLLAPDGSAYRLMLRPLLPDDEG